MIRCGEGTEVRWQDQQRGGQREMLTEMRNEDDRGILSGTEPEFGMVPKIVA